MPISQNTYTVPNNFVQQYDLGQKKIRADLVDENFTDAASAINTLLSDDANTVHLTGAETISGAKTFTAAITASGGVTGNITGNAATATALQTARTINGVSFDGTANITVADSTKVALDGSNLSGATVRVVTEEWKSGNNWYRVYSDGWIEQGGISGYYTNTDITINLNKNFSDKSYTALATVQWATSSSLGYPTYIKDKSTTTITLTTMATANKIANWYACGF